MIYWFKWLALGILVPLLRWLNINDSLVMSTVYGTIIARAIIKAFASEAWMFYVGKYTFLSQTWLRMTNWMIRGNCGHIGLLCFFYNEGNVNHLCQIKRNWKNQRCIVGCWKSITNWSDICLHRIMEGKVSKI